MDKAKQRLGRLQRMIHLQNHLRQMHEWKLTDLEHQKKQVDENRTGILGALDSRLMDGGLLIDLVARHLKTAAKKTAELEGASMHHQRQIEIEHRRLKHIERIFQSISREYHMKAGNHELLDIVDFDVRKKTD